MSNQKQKDKQQDKAVDMTFPASDPTARGKPTSTEAPGRPADRQAPNISRDEIERAQRGEGHAHHEDEDNAMGAGQPVDHPSRESVKVRQGTGPRETVSVLFVSLLMAAVAGAALLAYFIMV